ncbi:MULTISPECIES: CheR family methyltransferase [unclassified Candidatus Frackibacter]|uniref:CheR family methyltransferase n=1 Tax=unclassified Candidatus Frackibacter TaxID=2648818 RepID=UPI000885BD35|nr:MULTISPECIES: protein-glutamate O-methyltransferase CheR [unclassified Candidatus Frackibacter]SDC12675.1 chemotaxis protein methyltransferase CheR [Candidatus Frackibacter sp. WG11]SEM35732.1 chemotaxis protein methyltransferase CheR [Candidatus Frackibacter sp. WG12]SFL40900.1 chemotaxis protein methyltransferase CheR [Candidatus Frackibacter sp. WG13]
MTLDFYQFRDKASKDIDIDLSSYKMKRVKRRINSLMDRHNIKDYDHCLEMLKTDREFKKAFLSHFTINTSEFFRNPKNFKYLQEEVFPKLINKKKKIKIWSAACSDGSEPYTLAIMLNELNVKPRNFEIQATDIDNEILRTAKKGIYNENSIKKVDSKIVNKYFSKKDDKYILDPKIKRRINFKQHNLLKDSYGSGWDLILCRNVFIYFTKEIKDEITQKLSNALDKDGYLFLGNTEYLLNPSKYDLDKEFASFYKRSK